MNIAFNKEDVKKRPFFMQILCDFQMHCFEFSLCYNA